MPQRRVRRAPCTLLALGLRRSSGLHKLSSSLAAWGLASIADVAALLEPRARKLAGAIAGRALYDGRLDPAEALRLIHFPSESASLEEYERSRSPAHRRLIFEDFFWLALGLLGHDEPGPWRRDHVSAERPHNRTKPAESS